MCGWRPAGARSDVTLDDATSAIYSAFLIEEEGTASTFRALTEVFGSHGLPMSLYTDGARIILHADAGGEVDRSRRRRSACIGASGRRAYRGLLAAGARTLGAGVSHLAGSDWSRSWRSKRIDTVEAANLFLRDVYIPEYNARFAVAAAQEGTAFVAIPASTLRRFYASRRSVGRQR